MKFEFIQQNQYVMKNKIAKMFFFFFLLKKLQLEQNFIQKIG
jgi:restriction endonuclease S subunit